MYKIKIKGQKGKKSFWSNKIYKKKSIAISDARKGERSINMGVKKGFYPKGGVWDKTKLIVMKTKKRRRR